MCERRRAERVIEPFRPMFFLIAEGSLRGRGAIARKLVSGSGVWKLDFKQELERNKLILLLLVKNICLYS